MALASTRRLWVVAMFPMKQLNGLKPWPLDGAVRHNQASHCHHRYKNSRLQPSQGIPAPDIAPATHFFAVACAERMATHLLLFTVLVRQQTRNDGREMSCGQLISSRGFSFGRGWGCLAIPFLGDKVRREVTREETRMVHQPARKR